MSGLFKSKTISNSATKIADFQINSATYGANVPCVYGTSRRKGNVIDYYDFIAIPHTTTQKTGKGGGTKVQNTDYTYTVACVIGLSEGPISGIGRVWKDDEILTNPATMGLTVFTGAHGQLPWAYTQSKYPERALPYSGLAYVAGVVDLGSGGGLPNLNFEIKGQLLDTGDGIDANPADVINLIIFSNLNGIGFGQGQIDPVGLSRFRTYCQAANLLISDPAEDDTKKAYEIINELCGAANTISFWSQSQLKIIPLCDEYISANGAVYIPDNTPIYDLNEDDYLEDKDGRLVVFERTDPTQAFNQVPVEFINRDNNYEVETVKGEILVDINRRGVRTADTESIPYLYTKSRAQYVADIKVMKSLYGRNKYRFHLDWSKCLLEPGDLLTISLSSPTLELNYQPVIVDEVEEAEDGELEILAIAKPPGIYSPGRYTIHQADRPRIDYNADPGLVNEPAIFELPYILTEGKQAVQIAVAGALPMWGGAGVHLSLDGNTYKRIGEIKTAARYGVLAEALKTSGAVDEVNTLKVNTAKSRAQLLGGTREDATAYQTLCYVDGELIAYQNAELVDENRYNLTYLMRGCYGSEIKAHASGSAFVRLDRDILFAYEYLPQDIGRTIYIKLTSINVFGIREQALEDVEPYTYTIQGKLPDAGADFTVTQTETKLVASLKNTYSNPEYLDFYSYELRLGPTWEKGVLIDRFSAEKYTFDAPSEGTLTFWLKMVDQAGNYSKTATRSVVNVVNLPVRNIIFERQEDTSLWQVSNMWQDAAGRYRIKGIQTVGEYARFADMFGHPLYLRNDAEILFPPIDLGPNILDESCFWVDANGNIKLRSVEKLADFARFSDIFGAKLTPMKPEYAKETFVGIDVRYVISGNAIINIEYRASLDGLQWENWTPETVKQFSGRYVQIRLLPRSIDGKGQVYISGATVKIDVPDVEEIIENVTIPAARTRIYFKRKFAAVKSIAPYTQDMNGKQATCYIAEETTEYIDLEIIDGSNGIIAGKLQKVIIRGY